MHIHKLYLIFFLGVTSTGPTLWGDFVFDDGEAIVKNGDVTSSSENLTSVFKHDFWGVEITHPQSHKSYRPLTTITYRLDYLLWGQNPLPFHLVNLLIHGANCVLVYHFLKKCLKLKDCNNKIVFWASVVFAVHPIHVEPLGGLVGRADLLAAFVFLASFILIPPNKLYSPFLLSAAAILGSLFKENAIVLTIFYVLIQAVVNDRLKLTKTKCFSHILSLVLTCSFVAWRLWFQGGPPEFQYYDNPPAFAEGWFTKIFSILFVWLLNVYLLVHPLWLCYDWSMGCVRLVEYINDGRLAFIAIFIIVGLRTLMKSRKSKIVTTSLLISVTTFLPSSNLIFTVGFVLAERNLYLPSIGYCLLISYCMLRKKMKRFLYFVVIIFYCRSLQRSVQWMDQGTLFKSALDVCPGNAKIHYNLGTLYGEAGKMKLAISSYKQALLLRPDYYQAMNNLGNVLRHSDQMKEAEHWLRTAVETKKDFATAWMNLGIILSKKNKSEALNCYLRALKYRKIYPDCEYNLGNLYLDFGNKSAALKSWMRATSMKPTHSQAWINIVILLEQLGRTSEAKEWALKAASILSEEDTLQFLLGNILGKYSQYETAEQYFENAIAICTKANKEIPAKYYSNLGVLYHRWDKKDKAAHYYERALEVDPTLDSARANLVMLSGKK